MKYATITLMILFSTGIMAQKKSEMEAQLAAQERAIDSLNTRIEDLSGRLDTANTLIEDYQGMQQAIVDKVLGHDFEPSETAGIIDSLQANRDSTFAASATVWQDSVNVLLKKIEMLEALPIDSAALRKMMATEEAKDPAEMDKQEMMEELEMLKGLYDKGILTEEEYNTRKKKILDNW